jgi:hypothetical protein
MFPLGLPAYLAKKYVIMDGKYYFLKYFLFKTIFFNISIFKQSKHKRKIYSKNNFAFMFLSNLPTT